MAKMLIDGELREKPKQTDGQFKRIPSGIRNRIEADPNARFPAEVGRYHLYLSRACPWCHGVELVIALKGISEALSVTWMDPISSENGWIIQQGGEDASSDMPNHKYLYQAYQHAEPKYTGAISVPLLVDKVTRQIVSTDSTDMMRMLNSAFDNLGAVDIDLYPDPLSGEIDRITSLIQEPIRNGVYRAGFATTQEAYCQAVVELFEGLDMIEAILANRQYLAGSDLTEVDLKLFPTLVRFDAVYVTHFKTDHKRIADYPNLSRYMCALAQLRDVVTTIDMQHIREHYFRSHRHINPSGITSIGPISQFRETKITIGA